MKTIIASDTLDLDARDLFCFLRDHVEDCNRERPTNREPEDDDIDPCIVEVRDESGRTFSRVSLERETLSDGSHAYNLILSEG